MTRLAIDRTVAAATGEPLSTTRRLGFGPAARTRRPSPDRPGARLPMLRQALRLPGPRQPASRCPRSTASVSGPRTCRPPTPAPERWRSTARSAAAPPPTPAVASAASRRWPSATAATSTSTSPTMRSTWPRPGPSSASSPPDPGPPSVDRIIASYDVRSRPWSSGPTGRSIADYRYGRTPPVPAPTAPSSRCSPLRRPLRRRTCPGTTALPTTPRQLRALGAIARSRGVDADELLAEHGLDAGNVSSAKPSRLISGLRVATAG